jgi:hypothetical protein
MTILAEELAKAGDLSPVPLRAPDGSQQGAIYDPIMVAAVRARMALAAGATSGESRAPALIAVVVHPTMCNGAAIAPAAIRVLRGQRAQPPTGELRSGRGAQATLPGEPMPEGARLTVLPAFPLNDSTVEADFPASDCGDARTLTFEVQATPAAPVVPLTPWLPIPEGTRGVLSPTSVVLSAWIDRAGRARFVETVDGPGALADAATDYVTGLEFRPLALNATPVATQVSFRLGFRRPGEGQPATAASNSRSPEIATDAAPELAGAASRCPVSSDATYGFAATNPIRVGGDPFQGPARQRAFLANLRGPAGEAVRFRRIGSVPVGVNASGGLLDLYDVVHAGLEASVRLYMDLYSSGELQAPVGFACPAPFDIGG